MRRVHLNLVRAKHDRSKSLTIANKLSAVMLRPYEYICKNEMHPRLTGLFNFTSKIPNLKFKIE